MTDGEKLDKLRTEIDTLLASCRQREVTLTAAGVQAGSINFKSDRPNTMFIYEPTHEGQRRYVHVGVDPAKQAEARVLVSRWHQRDRLRRAIAALEADIHDMDWQIECVVRVVEAVYKHSKSTIAEHVKTGDIYENDCRNVEKRKRLRR